jgi:hypothetical protein
MSDLAPTYRTVATRSSWIALALALASVVAWVVAAGGADELWLGASFLGLVAAGLAWRSRREARRAGGKGTIALVAMLAGGLVAAQVIAFTIAWGIYHLAT